MIQKRARVLAAVSFSALFLTAGCTSLPGETSPQALRSFSPHAPDSSDFGPSPGQAPDLLLRDFFSASVKPTARHQAARAYLTDAASKQWDSQNGMLILDRIDINSKPESTADKMSFIIRGTVIGSLGTGGVYTPENGAYEATMDLTKENGEWRIAALPAGVVIERNELRNNYQPYTLFYFEPSGKMLEGDRRWLFTGNSALGSSLMSLLVSGPKEVLASGVRTRVPQGATFTGLENGIYNFTGFGDLSADDRHKFAAQVVWTLARAGVAGPYRINVDGAPLLPEVENITLEEVSEFNPTANNSSASPLFAVKDGNLSRVSDTGTTPVDGALGRANKIESVDLVAGGSLAATVLGEGEGEDKRSYLTFGSLDSNQPRALEGKTLTRPTIETSGAAAWTALDGKKVIRVARSASTGELSQTPVDTTEVDGIDGLISVLQLSQTGVRVAFISGGRVYMGTVAQPGPAERKITNVREIAPVIGDTALTLDWLLDGSLVIGTSSQETPVWHVQSDGSSITNPPTGNLTAPVVSVVSNATTYFVTDSRAVLQLPITGADSSFWREVPGLQGTRAAPVVAH